MKLFLKITFSLLTFFIVFSETPVFGFDDSVFFTADDKLYKKSGLIGKSGESNESGETQSLLLYIPKFTNILIWTVAPIIAGMFIFAGIQFVYAGGDEEQLNSSKQFFQYGIMGIIFIFASYSLMLAVYKIIAA
jgi:hypothetical protein